MIPAGPGGAPDRDALGARRDGQLVQCADAGGVDCVVLQRRQPGGIIEHQVCDAVQAWPCPPPSRVTGQHDSLRGAVQGRHDERTRRRTGPIELTLIECLGCGGHTGRQQHAVAREHTAPLRVRLGERHHGLPVVDPSGYRRHTLGAAARSDLECLVGAADRMNLAGDVPPGDRGPVGPHRLGIDGVGDHLRGGPGQLDAGEVVGVDRRRAVRSDDERARQGGFHHRRDLGVVAVDVQDVEVGRKVGERQAKIAAVLQRGGILLIDVAGGANRGPAVRSGREFELGTGGRASGEHHSHDERC
ncbi:Uncharacterised protein [Mycobacterium tuberculosis]|nr:Uncharacterised protein [Mycobacterium tuberculosis]